MKGRRTSKQKSSRRSVAAKLNVKLPKLVTTKFHGTHLDWQFEGTIDKSDIAQVAKILYLKELLVPRNKAVINWLPFNRERCIRAKNILMTKVKGSSYSNAHIQCKMVLSVITETNPRRINEFYEKLVTNIQTLESMGRKKDIRGNVRPTLDKLPGKRADLVRLDDNWQEWRFPQLVGALRN